MVRKRILNGLDELDLNEIEANKIALNFEF